MQWFRMYHEARDDPKLGTLSDAQHRVWFALMCLASDQPAEDRGTVPYVSRKLLAVKAARRDVALLEQTIAALRDLDILLDDEERLVFIHWDKRQFQSDSSAPRVAKHRAMKRSSNVTVALPKRDVTVMKRPVTAPETETDAETDAEQSALTRATVASNGHVTLPDGARAFARDTYVQFDQAYPKPLDFEECFPLWAEKCGDEATFRAIMVGLDAWINSSSWQQGWPRYVTDGAKWLAKEAWKKPPKGGGAGGGRRPDAPAERGAGGDRERVEPAVRAAQVADINAKLERIRTGGAPAAPVSEVPGRGVHRQGHIAGD